MSPQSSIHLKGNMQQAASRLTAADIWNRSGDADTVAWLDTCGIRPALIMIDCASPSWPSECDPPSSASDVSDKLRPCKGRWGRAELVICLPHDLIIGFLPTQTGTVEVSAHHY